MMFSKRVSRRHALAICGAVCVAAAVLTAVPAAAQGFPEKPVRIVVPYPAGGTTDYAARLIAERLTRSLGQSFVVDNKPGGTGTIGALEVLRAPAMATRCL